jgi:phosphopantothenoylcysteine synthetase/decarboxylase
MAKQDDKLFTVAGTATNPDGTTKVRFANDLVARVKILTKAGCTNIELVELPEPMTKLAALEYLQEQRKAGDEGYVIANKLSEKSKAAKRKGISVTLKAGVTIGTKSKETAPVKQADEA